MPKYLRTIIAGSLAMIPASPAIAQAKPPVVVVVDSEVLLTECSRCKVAERELARQMKEDMAGYDAIQEQVASKVAEAAAAGTSDSIREAEIADLRERARRLQQSLTDQYNGRREVARIALTEYVKSLVVAVMKQRGYSIAIDSRSVFGLLAPSLNITGLALAEDGNRR